MAAARLSAAFALAIAACLAQAQEAARLFGERCAQCHGADRLGGNGPALLPENLERLRRPAAAEVIARGRAATQMPGFGAELTERQVQQLVEFIYARPERAPTWTLEDIRASRQVHAIARPDAAAPVYRADPKKLFVVVETGDHHVTLLDGERFEPIRRFATRYALHGGPKFSPDGRFVYFGSRDGWVQKYDLWNLRMVAEVRAGINTRNIAASSDGKYLAVANYLPHTLAILDADLNPVKIIPARDQAGTRSSRVSAVYDAAPRRSFVVALKDVRELWEISYDPAAADLAAGTIHDYRYREGAFVRAFLEPRRTPLEDYLDDFFFTPDYSQLVGASRDAAQAQVVHLDVRRAIAVLPLPGMPHLGSGVSWEREGRRVMATPNLREGLVSVIDVKDWKVVKQIPTRGAGFFLRSHEATPYAWVDAFNSAHRDTLQVIDKRTLEVVRELRPAPGKTTAHVEFSADGRHALVSVWEMDGEIVVYDAATFEIVRRLPMKKPSGKYNVHNKITRSEGTSH